MYYSVEYATTAYRPTTACLLLLPTAYCQLLTYCLLPTTACLLPTTICLLPTKLRASLNKTYRS